jgi:hypothetical protein
MTTGKQVPLAEVSRLRQDRRKLQAEVARLEAEKQGWLVEKAHLISALRGTVRLTLQNKDR